MGRQAGRQAGRQVGRRVSCMYTYMPKYMAWQQRHGCERAACLHSHVATRKAPHGMLMHACEPTLMRSMHPALCGVLSPRGPGSGSVTPPPLATAALLLLAHLLLHLCLRTAHMRRPRPPLPSCCRRALQWMSCCLGHPCGGGTATGGYGGWSWKGTSLRPAPVRGGTTRRTSPQRAVRAAGKGSARWTCRQARWARLNPDRSAQLPLG